MALWIYTVLGDVTSSTNTGQRTIKEYSLIGNYVS